MKSFKKILIKSLKEVKKIVSNCVYLGDCLETLRAMPSSSVSACVMDGPYILHTKPGKKSGCYANKGFIDEIAPFCDGFSVDVLKEIVRVCKKINCVFFCSAKQLDFYTSFFEQYDVKIVLHTWQKTNPFRSKGAMLSDTEYIVQVCDKSLLDEVDTTPVHFISPKYVKMKKKYGHGTIKPVEYMAQLIEKVSKPGDLILDPFAGTNSTGVGALITGRNFIACELEEKYANVSEQRVLETMAEFGIEALNHDELVSSIAIGEPEEMLKAVEHDEFDMAVIDTTAFAEIPLNYINMVAAKMTKPCLNIWVKEDDILKVSMNYARQGYSFDIIYSYGSTTMAMIHLRRFGKLYYGTYHTSRHFYVDDGKPYQPKSRNAKKVIVEQSVGTYDDSIPYMVMRNTVLNCTQPGDVVLDLTMGNGITAEICTRTDRRFIGAVQDKDSLICCAERISKAKELKGGDKFDISKALTVQ